MSEWIDNVLNSAIPPGGFGRSLTETEVRALRRLGYRELSRRCVVVRTISDYKHNGQVYRPVGQGGYSASGIYVRWMGD